MGHSVNTNRLCNIGNQNATSCTVSYDGNGNILAYARPTAAQSNNTPGADGATLTLSGYTAFNLPTRIVKTGGTGSAAAANFYYDAGYQRVRQQKFNASGTQVDDILYVVPGGFEVHRDINGKVISSTATVSGPDGVIATVTTTFDANTGQAVVDTAQTANTSNLSGLNTITKVLLKDHLGSMVAEITLGGTPSAPVIVVNSLTVHGFGPWGNARNGLNADQRGFTGHEHLAELGIIHMNGRLYDPVLGRFLQADPIIQAPHNAQSHNRYVYVLNNPLSFTDPSGFSAWTKWRAPILSLATVWFLGPGAYSFIGLSGISSAGIVGAISGASGTLVSFASAVSAGFAAGGIQGGNVQSALQGAFSAALFFGVGQLADIAGAGFEAGSAGAKAFGEAGIGRAALHAAAGCISGAAAGGSCAASAGAAGFAEFAGGQLPKNNAAQFLGRAIIRGIAARIAGGKFENGAMTAAFGYLLNCGVHDCLNKRYSNLPDDLKAATLDVRGAIVGKGDPTLLGRFERVTVSYVDQFEKDEMGNPLRAEAFDRSNSIALFKDSRYLSDKPFLLAHEFAHLLDSASGKSLGDFLKNSQAPEYELNASRWATGLLGRPSPSDMSYYEDIARRQGRIK